MSKRKATAAPRAGGATALAREVPAVERDGFIVDVDERDVTLWTVALEPRLLRQHGLETLVADLGRWARMAHKPEALVLELRFPSDYPREPPFVRVLRPRFVAYTGHVTAGGSICTELLTSGGWRGDMAISSVLRTVCEGFRDGEGRLEVSGALWKHDYDLLEAQAAFDRALLTHGWRAPARQRL